MLLFAPVLFAALLVCHNGLDAIPQRACARVAAWLMIDAGRRRSQAEADLRAAARRRLVGPDSPPDAMRRYIENDSAEAHTGLEDLVRNSCLRWTADAAHHGGASR